jgi:2-haloacid dehalogenase
MPELAPHPEVPDALRRLHKAGLRLCARSPTPPRRSQRRSSSTRASPDSSSASCPPTRCAGSSPMLRSTTWPHANAGSNRVRCSSWPRISWDAAGALRAGCAAAFVARPGMVLDLIFGQPDIVGADVAAVAERILAGDGPGKPISRGRLARRHD